MIRLYTAFYLTAFLVFTACGTDESSRQAVPDGPHVTREGEELIVTAGESAMRQTPVAVSWSGDVPECLDTGGTQTPAQLEKRAGEGDRLWWTVTLEPEQTRIYRSAVRGECEGRDIFWELEDPGLLRLMDGDRPVIDYVHPVYDPERVEETKKPFHHVYSPDGSRLITKGVGGIYSHHRGIFFGYNRVQFNGRELDIWHAEEGERPEHATVIREWTGPVFGGHEVSIEWKDRDGTVFAEEIRRVNVFPRSDRETIVDVDIILHSRAGEVVLDGDLHHAGVQFRAAQYVNDHSEHSRYLRPSAWADEPDDQEIDDPDHFRDLPWNAFRFVVEQQPYTVGYLSHPINPSGAEMSERLYGRFGEFIPAVIDEGEPLRLRYRWIIHSGHEADRERMEGEYRLFSLTD